MPAGYYSSGNYYFAQGQMTRCQSFCTRCWYYGYPGGWHDQPGRAQHVPKAGCMEVAWHSMCSTVLHVCRLCISSSGLAQWAVPPLTSA